MREGGSYIMLNATILFDDLRYTFSGNLSSIAKS